MQSRQEEATAKAAAVKAEVEALLSLLSLPGMVVRVQVDPRGLTGTRVVVMMKDSDQGGEGQPHTVP